MRRVAGVALLSCCAAFQTDVLLTPPLALTTWVPGEAAGTSSGLASRWWITYVVPADCDAACRNSWEALPRMQAGLGRYRDRVGVLLISGAGSAAVPDALRRDPQVRAAKAEVVQRHGSRRKTSSANGPRRATTQGANKTASNQLSLDL